MSHDYIIRNATRADGDDMLALVPRLAAFDIPSHREPQHLWQDDEALLRRWLAGDAEQCLVQVAVADKAVLGFTLTSLRPEPLSHAPGAHLEAIAVAGHAERRGIGEALLTACEENSVKHGAKFLTLHVIASNARARALYEKRGFEGELLRYIKPLDEVTV